MNSVAFTSVTLFVAVQITRFSPLKTLMKAALLDVPFRTIARRAGRAFRSASSSAAVRSGPGIWNFDAFFSYEPWPIK